MRIEGWGQGAAPWMARLAAGFAAAVVVAACGGGASPGSADPSPPPVAGPAPAGLGPEAALGRLAFFDAGLSASGAQSCASCHDPQAGHAAANSLSVQFGGAHLDVPGLRNSQMLRYLAANTGFTLDAEGNPSGGFFWDGRADGFATQAAAPLLGELEMANGSAAAVAAKIARASWAPQFVALYGEQALASPELALQKLGEALQHYQAESPEFQPFSSKFDTVNAGKAEYTAQEARGLALFNDEAKGNCAACHSSAPQADGKPALFTDFSYDALGVPRNAAIPANADPAYFDLGVCARPGMAGRGDLCGAFKVPSLRNVALRQRFFHNGSFTSLREVVSFYVTRDTDPGRWYPRAADGSVQKFNDLPPQYRANVNTTEAPYNRQPGQAPALTEAEIDDVVAFLRTLSDGWTRP